MTKLISQNNTELLETLFSSSTRVALLRVFLLDPHRSYYQRQLEVITGMALRAVQRELERLHAVDLLYRHMQGNRAFYMVDSSFPLFSELRSIVMKSGDDRDRLRGHLADRREIQLAFLNAGKKKALAVVDGDVGEVESERGGIQLEYLTLADFQSKLEQKSKDLKMYLSEGEDILGRREHIIWSRIEQAGYEVPKGKGIP